MNARCRFKMLMTLAGATMLAALTVAQGLADPLPGRDVLKFSQQPMDGTPIFDPNGTVQFYWGHDELSTAYSEITPNGPSPYRGQFMADDFADKFKSPVVHVKWWGSYINQNTAQLPVDKFLISFESDIPANPLTGFSRPGTPLLNQIVRRVPVGALAPGSGTYTESPISPGGAPLFERLYEYNAELHLNKEFFQEPDTVYWLKIVALVDLPPGVAPDAPFIPKWGWHNRDYTKMDPLASTPPAVVPGEFLDGVIGPGPVGVPIWHFQDDAVTGGVFVNHLSTPMGQIMPFVEQFQMQPTRYLNGIDGPGPIPGTNFPGIGAFSKDLAFELYTIPEPAGFGLMGVALAVLASVRRRASIG
jgi:hypothetical protein